MYVMKVIDRKGGGGHWKTHSFNCNTKGGKGGAHISITTEKMLALNNVRFSITVA